MSFIHSLTKLRQTIEVVLKTYELIYGDIHYVTNVKVKSPCYRPGCGPEGGRAIALLF